MISLMIREYEEPHYLVKFPAIASRLEPFARGLVWAIDYVEGTTAQGAGLTLDDAIEYAERTIVEPITWDELQVYACKFFQIYDCKFRGLRIRDGVSCTEMTIECVDSGFWEVSMPNAADIQALSRVFEGTTLPEIG